MPTHTPILSIKTTFSRHNRARGITRRTLGASAHKQSNRVDLFGCAAADERRQAAKVRENALYLVFKLVMRLSLNWRGINAPNQLRLLLAGHQFRDGQLVLDDAPPRALAVSA